MSPADAVSDFGRHWRHWSPSGDAWILLDDQRRHGPSYLFQSAAEWVAPRRLNEIDDALRQMEAAQRNGKWLAGFAAYELGLALEPKLQPLLDDADQPLMVFGVFDERRALSADKRAEWLTTHAAQPEADIKIGPGVNHAAYACALERIHEYLRSGDAYQINFTFKLPLGIAGDPCALFGHLRPNAQSAYGAFLHLGDIDILSFSPELFLEKRGDRIRSKPMKGTAPRGRNAVEDEKIAEWLRQDPKSRAENLMIVDLIRNDLGRLATPGSVCADALFDVVGYPTLLQMTSTVSANLRPGQSIGQILRALFPCGSITGAPKIRAMEIIHELEAGPRGVYTGAIGAIGPNGDFDFNVAIRTIVAHRDGQGEIGVGGGIVADSEVQSEFAEAHLKADFLRQDSEPFELIETFRWEVERGYYLLDLHLDRLASSATYFNFALDIAAVRVGLQRAAEKFEPMPQRVRILLAEDGSVSIVNTQLAQEPDRVQRYVISQSRVNSTDPFFFHKTTRRALFDQERAAHGVGRGCDEVLFLNENGELTEGSYTNIFVEIDGVLYTPPVACGLLNGCLRQSLFLDDDRRVVEKVLTPQDLERAERIFLGNSVRGLQEAAPVAAALVA
jgi:para-aminobenzoate synthetase/4-amino-4-deoxychorismate lyase